MMGKPITRLNPQVESTIQRILLEHAVKLVVAIVMLFPVIESNKRGPKPYDYRVIVALCILRILFRKTYADYEIEMRTDPRICKKLRMQILPGKSTIQRGMEQLSMKRLRELNTALIQEWIQRKLNIIIDASGIRIIGRSIWYCIRAKIKISRCDCDKAHLAVCSDLLLVLNWRITKGSKHDSPFFRVLLAPFRWLGVVIGDAGYLARKNFQFVADRKGAAFIPFKKNSTAKPKSHPAWKAAFWLWTCLKTIYNSVYHQHSKIEAVFSALKRRYGDKLYSGKAYMRRREFALRLIAYNIRLVLCLRYAYKHNLNLWVRA